MGVDVTDEGRAALGRAVKRGREARRLSIDNAADAAPMSPVTWSKVERGERVRGLTYAGIEKVLGWAPGSVDRIFDGGEPIVLQNVPTPGRLPADFNLRNEYRHIRDLTVSCETKLGLLGEIIEMYEQDRAERRPGREAHPA